MTDILNIGLLMTYNEEDIIEEMMDANAHRFEAIYVLDGSTDKTADIIQRYKNVKFLLKDQEIYPKRRITDGVRQFLLERAQADYGYEGWFTLLHGDEILVDDPNEVAARADRAGAERVNWHSLNFFLHSSQQDQVFDPKKPIQDQVVYYHPGGLEIRQFKNKQGIFYDLNQICNVVPKNVGLKTLLDYPVLKHYVIRSVAQKQKKPHSGIQVIRDRGGQDAAPDMSDIFKDKLSPELKQVRKYDGSLHEFEPGQRPPFIVQWWRWQQYKPIDWGVFKPIIPKRFR